MPRGIPRAPRVAGDAPSRTADAVAQRAAEAKSGGRAADDWDFEEGDERRMRSAAPVHEPVHSSRYAESPEPVHDDLYEWTPSSLLQAPEARPGFVQRWIRSQRGNEMDGRRLQQAKKDGWQPRDMSTVPEGEWAPPTDAHKVFGSCIAVEGMVLMEKPIARKRARDRYFDERRRTQMQSVTEQLLRVQEPGHPIGQSIQSRVTVGRRRPPVQPDD